ncbi:MAG: type II secretion system protein N [Pseudomonadales bacterium]
MVVGLLLFLGFAVAFAPAALIRTVLPAEVGVDLLEPSGTLWNGVARLYLGGQDAGLVDWRFRPVAILQGRLGYAVELSGPGHTLSGNVAAGLGAGRLEIRGSVAAAVVNRWLSVYDIAITGAITLDGVELTVPYDFASTAAGSASGDVTWEGGPVRYRLAGRDYAGALPPLAGHLGPALEAVVFPQDGQTPLLKAAILPNGFAKVGITMLLTQLAGNPWPGSHQDHEVVLEVEEQLF